MYNSLTAAEIRSVTHLKGLDIDRLPQKLTEAYARIVSARISTLEERDEVALNEIIKDVERLGYAYLALVNFAPTREAQKSAAFVAGSAFELVAMNRSAAYDGSFTSTSICPTCSAALLFIIADSISDAAEVMRYLPLCGTDGGLDEHIKQSIRCLAMGDLTGMAESQDDYSSAEPEEFELRAVAELYKRCLIGIRGLCRALIGSDSIDNALAILRDTKESCIDNCSDMFTEDWLDELPTFSTFSGPFWLSSLLETVANHLFQYSLINVSTPDIGNAQLWLDEIKRRARYKPYLWPNHRRIIEVTKCLDRGVSSVLGLPTGAGKTTIAELKATAALVDNQKVLYLAPTHALVTQVTNDWRKAFPNKVIRNSFLFDGEYAETENGDLPDIAVMTPERCLSLLMIAPEAFRQAGLIILDECHILHALSLDTSYRATDAMFCLHRLFDIAEGADFMLMSAMVENTDDLAVWIEQQTGHRCAPVSDEWKPTRQARCCVIYPHREIQILQQKLRRDKVDAEQTGRRSPRVAIKRELEIHPYGFFSLNQSWNTTQLRDYVVLPLASETVLLNANKYWYLTANRNDVSASLAVKLADASIKTIVFSQQVNHTLSIARQVAEKAQLPGDLDFNEREQELWNRLIEELGAADHIYGPINGIAGCHHGLLLADERELIEGLFARQGGIKVLVATPTIAQGMNLPAEAVIIAGDDRFDAANNEQEQLEAHELLNAAGRAGRAGQRAQGFVFIVPGSVVDFDDGNNTLSERWFTLQQNVFSKSDQCLTIVDPFQRLIDTIHMEAVTDNPPINYMLRRMPYNASQTPEENVRRTMMRSFAAFIAQRQGEVREFIRKVDATVELGRTVIQPVEIEEHQWTTQLATELGIEADVLLEIDLHLDDILPDWNIIDYIRWSFENHFIQKLVKPQTIQDIITNMTTPAERKTINNINVLCLNRVEPLLLGWIRGSQFIEIEGLAGTQHDRLAKCDIARKLVLRWSVDLSYALGVITRLYRRRCGVQNKDEMPTVLATLAACVRQGVDMPAKLAILHILQFNINRVRAHRIYNEIQNRLRDGDIFESFAQTMRRTRIAMRRTGIL